MDSITEILTRQQLYDLAWSTPMVNLSKKYAITDTGLRKICARMNIPLPDNGHWIKIQFGKDVPVKLLPDDLECEQQIELSLRKEGEEVITDPVKKLAKQIIVPVPVDLATPDSLVLAAKKRLTGKEATCYNFPGMVECKRDELDIRVAPAHVSRALRIMDSFVKALRTRHHDIHFRNAETYANVKGEDIKFALHERAKRAIVNDRSWGNTELQPTGILCFKAGRFTMKEWKDSSTDPNRRVEHFLPEVIAWMEGEADYWNNARAESRKEEAVRKQKEQDELRKQELIRAEQAAFEGLLRDSERWDKVRKLREYIAEAERRGADAAWVEWARGKAEGYDPFGG